MTLLAPERTTRLTSDDDLTHLVCCCNEDVAFCGEDVSGSDWAAVVDADTCVVCHDLWPYEVEPACPRCGCLDC